MSRQLDHETTVQALLQQAGVTPSDDEVAAMVAGYPTTRAMVESLHTMLGVRYEEPAVIFDARP
jgi:hypothetical protein